MKESFYVLEIDAFEYQRGLVNGVSEEAATLPISLVVR